VRAPAAPALVDPDAIQPAKPRLPAWDETRVGRRRTIVLHDDDHGRDAAPVAAAPAPVVDLRRHPEYVGRRAGRPAFGDDPASPRPQVPGYVVDRSGAFEPTVRPPRGGRLIVVTPQPRELSPPPAYYTPVATPMIRRPDTTPSAPLFARTPPPVYYSPRPIEAPRVHHQPAPPPVAYRAAPAPSYAPPPRIVGPSPAPSYSPPPRVVAPAPAPSFTLPSRAVAPAAVHHSRRR
jgi:hypothetical protein